MATATSTIVNALRYTYGVNKVQYMFNHESPTYKMLGKVKKPMGGRGQFIIPVVTKNAGAWKGITEGGALPTALAPATAEASFALHEFVGLYDMTWKLIQDSRTDKFAFQQALQFLDDGVRRRVLRNLNSDFVDDGRGRVAIASGANTAGTFPVAHLPRVDVGQVVDVMANSDDDTLRGAGNFTVTAVDTAARTITLSGTPTSTAAGDYAVIAATCDISVTTTALHTNGLLGVISDANPTTSAVVGNYGTINRSTAGNEYWKAFVSSNSGTNRPLTEDILLTAMDGMREKGGGTVKAWISNLALIRRYHEMLASERYFALSKPGILTGGIGRKNVDRSNDDSEDGLTPYEFSGVPWYSDPYFNANTIVGLDTEHFFLGVGDNDAPRPISEIFDNIPFFRQTTSATFEVAWYFQCELLSDFPAAGVKVKDIAEA